jgi:hypothetical protein
MKLVHWLRDVKEHHHWDVADVCLATCEKPILRLCSGDAVNGIDVGRSLPGQLDSGNDLWNSSTFGIDPGIFDQNGHNWCLHTGPSVLETQNNMNGFEYPVSKTLFIFMWCLPFLNIISGGFDFICSSLALPR